MRGSAYSVDARRYYLRRYAMKRIIRLAVLITLIRYSGDVISRQPEVIKLRERAAFYAEAAAEKLDCWLEKLGFSDPAAQNPKSL